MSFSLSKIIVGFLADSLMIVGVCHSEDIYWRQNTCELMRILLFKHKKIRILGIFHDDFFNAGNVATLTIRFLGDLLGLRKHYFGIL